jgi:hypothetical protein
MSMEDMEPLPEDVARLLRQGRPGVEPPLAAREAVRSFVAAHAVTAAAAAVAHGAAAGATRASATSAVTTWGAVKGSFGVGGIVLGVALGAGGHAALIGHEARVAAPVPAPRSSLVVGPSGQPATSADAAPWTTVEPVAVASAAPAHAAHTEDESLKNGRDSALRAERALIDTAQTAVARRDPEAALATLARHAREFPHGQFAEEREWLTIQALILTGRGDDARARATAFRRTFPQSLMLPALDHLVPPAEP